MLISRRGMMLGLGLVGLAGTSTAAYATAIEPFGLVVTRYRPSAPGWPATIPLRIVVIADLHAGGPNVKHERVRQVVDTANGLGGDLTLLLGDYVADHRYVTERVPHEVWGGELARLSAPLGVWAILGNHDWWRDVHGIRGALRAAGIPVLENDAMRIGRNGKRFWLAGLGDQLAIKIAPHRYRGVDDLSLTMRKVRTDEPMILMAHEPDIFPRVPERVALTLAGHTHGGQIRLPMIGPIYRSGRHGARYSYGHIVEQDRHMIVSGGIGTSIVPMRLGVPPEIVVVELGSVDDAGA